MKICMVSDLYLPEPGGIAEHIYHLARELRRRGHIVKILTSTCEGMTRGGPEAVAPDEGFVFRVGRGLLIPANRSLSRITIGVRVGTQVRRFLHEEQFDFIHIHGSLAPTLPLAALKNSCSINVATFHASHKRSAAYRVFHSYLIGYFRKLHGLIAVSEPARRTVARYFPGNYSIIPNGVDTDFFHPGASPMRRFANARPTVMFLGRFEPRKGLSYLLKALPRIKRAIPDVQCIVVGSGPLGVEKYRRQLDPDVADAVEFTGTIPSPERPRYFASCSVFVAPSTGNESFGIILLEAMATGKPVVASDIDGYRDVLADGVEGLLVPPKDEDALAEAIIAILNDPQRAYRMGVAGRAKALSYSWLRVTDQVEAYYHDLVARYGRRLPAYE